MSHNAQARARTGTLTTIYHATPPLSTTPRAFSALEKQVSTPSLKRHTPDERGRILGWREQAQTKTVLCFLAALPGVHWAGFPEEAAWVDSREVSATERDSAGSGPVEAWDEGTEEACYQCGTCWMRYKEPHLAAPVSVQRQAFPPGSAAGQLGRESLCSAGSPEPAQEVSASYYRTWSVAAKQC